MQAPKQGHPVLDSVVAFSLECPLSQPSTPYPTPRSPWPHHKRPCDWESVHCKCGLLQLGWQCGPRGHSPNVLLPRASQMTPFSDWPKAMASSQSKRAGVWAPRLGTCPRWGVNVRLLFVQELLTRKDHSCGVFVINKWRKPTCVGSLCAGRVSADILM